MEVNGFVEVVIIVLVGGEVNGFVEVGNIVNVVGAKVFESYSKGQDWLKVELPPSFSQSKVTQRPGRQVPVKCKDWLKLELPPINFQDRPSPIIVQGLG